MTLEATTSDQNSFGGYSEMSGYFRHFGFKRDPFGVEEKESSLYLLPNWEQQIDLMLHYVRHENVLLTLTGPKGIGKTTLINFFLLEAIHGFSPTETAVQSDLAPGEFLVQLGDVVRTCQVLADSALSPEQMLEVMAGAFDVSTEHFLGSFEGQADILLDKLQYNKQSCVLLIDDAHELPNATLELLLYMVSQQSENQHRFHVVLIGESALKKQLVKISKAKDYSGLTHSVELDPLNLAQTEYYLKHRFSAAGFTDEALFSNGMINKIYKLSGGVPKFINQLARQSLLEMLKKKKFSSLGAIFKPYKKTFIGGGFLLASFAIILLYLGQDVNLKPQQVSTPPTQPIAPAPVVSHPPEVSQAVVTAANKEQPQIQPPQAQSQPQVQSQPQNTLQNPVVAPEASTQKPVSSQPQLSSPAHKSIVETSSLIEPTSSQASENTQVTAPLLLPSQKPAVKETVRVKAGPLPEDKPEQPKPVLGKHKAKKSTYAASLMKKDSNHYTLKLREMLSETDSQAFIAKYKLGSNVSYYRARIGGADKYIVIYGEYANSETAKQAIAFLPKPLQHFEPKPYQIGAIQKIVRDAA